MNLLNNTLYRQELERTSALSIDWDKLENTTILVSGATGMIGSFLIDVLMYKAKDLKCKVIALGRNNKKAMDRFFYCWESPYFTFLECDINQPIEIEESVDFIFHAASNTHPLAYANDPIGTVTANIIGTYHLLELAAQKKIQRFIFASSVEIYGENRGDCEYFTEDYCGYIDCNTLRAGYPESKRAGESLCQAYKKQKNIDVVIPRLSRTYGPTMLMTDSKALSQFIKKGLQKEDIVLKSEGTQFYSYSYVADAVSGILYCLLYGVSGEAYNIADQSSDITLRDLAKIIAGYVGKKVVFELPDETERAGYSKATKAVLDSTKLKCLGWKPMYSMEEGLKKTLDILAK